MRFVLACLASLSLTAHAAPSLNQKPKSVEIKDDKGGRNDGTPWSSDMIKDKVWAVFYVDPDHRDKNERLKEVKSRRVEILKKRLARFVQAEESREVVSHQLASIEDLLRLTHEQSIAIRDPQVVTRQLDALSAEVAATEETVRDMESFMVVTEELSSTPGSSSVKVRS